MFQRILVPLDGSPLAERALAFASTLSKQHQSELVLVRAAEAHVPPYGELTAVLRRAEQEAQEYLETVAGRLHDAGHTEVVVSHESPGQGIVDETRLRRADLVVMSTHRRSDVGRVLLGSVADHVVRHSTVPVLLVPPTCIRTWEAEQLGGLGRPMRILVPLDGSAHGEAALEVTQVIASGAKSTITLLSVVELAPTPFYAADSKAEMAAQKTYLRAQAGRLSGGAEVRTCVDAGTTAGCILEHTRNHQADLVVMATHGRGGLSRLVLGSVTADVLHQLDVPLLIVRPAIAVGERAEVAASYSSERTPTLA